MPKLLICDRYLLYAHNPYLVCAVHLDGVDGDSCLDFREDPNAQAVEVWEPEGATYYNGELILQPRQRWIGEQQLDQCREQREKVRSGENQIFLFYH